MNDVTIDRFTPPMKCFLVECDEFLGNELGRCLESTEALLVEELQWTDDLVSRVPAGSTVILNVRGSNIESSLSVLHELFEKRVTPMVVGNPEIRPYSLLFHSAGAVVVVTDIFQCDRLASVIRGAIAQQREILTDWRTRFVNRIPWNPV